METNSLPVVLQNVQNPLADYHVIQKLLDVYQRQNNGFGGFYGQMQLNENKIFGRVNAQDKDVFYTMMFNQWKGYVLAMKKEEFAVLAQQGSYDQDFVSLRNYLKKVPDAKNMSEVEQIMLCSNEPGLAKTFEKYYWTAFGRESSWRHVCSRYVTAKKDSYPKIEHRLYLDPQSTDTYALITNFVKQCIAQQLPYYFKFDEVGKRRDTVVIYADSENLPKYVDILQTIKAEQPELVARMQEPPILAGKVDDWIGYGSEPAKTADGQNQSYNSVRAKCAEQAIGVVLHQWILENKNTPVEYQEQAISYHDYLIEKAVDVFTQTLVKRCKHYQQHYHTDPGYTIDGLQSEQFQQDLRQALRQNIGPMVKKICTNKITEQNYGYFMVKSGKLAKPLEFSNDYLNEAIRKTIPEIERIDVDFNLKIKQSITALAPTYGIDAANFCFDAKDKVKEVEK